MKTALFDYELPPELVAQRPLPDRDGARMMVLDRSTGRIEHSRVRDLPRFLSRGDLLVVNRTRVFPARLFATKGPAGARLEVFLLKETSRRGPVWEALLCPGKRIKGEVVLHFEGGARARVVSDLGEGHFLVNFTGVRGFGRFLREAGHVPLPPYIRRPDEPSDRERYQTIFARRSGSVAAPTAGLHFTPRLLEGLRRKGVRRAAVTLHVGLGTFLPVTTEEIEDHRMHSESYEVPDAAVAAVRRARSAGGRVVAVGTTSLRALESAARDGEPRPGVGTTDLFVRPGYRFRVVDALFTNFHQPGSTLLMLVSAFCGARGRPGRETVLAAYREAVRERYRFFSYGDAMLLR
jgi:S-adenosylmethionine:tRNA ribosyltransferase-isomerase